MNDAQPPPHGSQQVMQSAGYFRDQATLCLEIARHISNLQAVENLRASAARHLVKADDVEKRSGGQRSISPAAVERSKVSDVAREKQGSHGELGDESQGEGR